MCGLAIFSVAIAGRDLPEMAEGSRDFLRRMGDCPGRGYGVPRAGGWARFGAHPIERTRETSGLDLRDSGAHLYTIRDGKVTHLTAYLERERAFADLGLKEA